MKNIKNFILESSSQEIEKNIEDCAWGIIDEFNQEGIQGWDEDDIKDYVNSDKEPDYEYIVNTMISELEEYGDRYHILQYLKKYHSDDSWGKSIEIAILRAMQDYVKNI
ncbi:hypothetical protein IKN40_00020 [bacterium]|nr:hypothetical protein [bacterium]